MHMGYLKVLYVKKYSDKFSVSSNICTRNLTINSNLSQGCFGMPNRIHASLAKSFIFPANKMNSGLNIFNLMHFLADTICLTLFGISGDQKQPSPLVFCS